MRCFFMFSLGAALLLAGMTACADNDDGATANANPYANDGAPGTANAIPNSPLNPGHHTYAADLRVTRTALADIPGIRSSTVLFNGTRMHVRIDLNDDVDIERAMQIKAQTLARVSRMMPRYDVDVAVGKSSRLNPMR